MSHIAPKNYGAIRDFRLFLRFAKLWYFFLLLSHFPAKIRGNMRLTKIIVKTRQQYPFFLPRSLPILGRVPLLVCKYVKVKVMFSLVMVYYACFAIFYICTYLFIEKNYHCTSIMHALIFIFITQVFHLRNQIDFI